MTTNARYQAVIEYFSANMPHPESELEYSNAYQLLVAVMLSAQCTDKRVNMVTPRLFKAYPTPQAMAQASPEKILDYVSSVSYPNAKSSHLAAMARQLVANHGGNVPQSIDELMKLPGVGRKTANVVAAVLWNAPVMPVDTHVFRVANRIGLTTNSPSPEATEAVLEQHFPPELMPKAHHWLLLHGRYVCTARNPHCTSCGLSHCCRDYAKQKSCSPRKKQTNTKPKTP
ncbi:MAG: endonuclease III [Bacteroidales bacterium]|nr:endonuclease III [Bacteroidales bacterium]